VAYTEAVADALAARIKAKVEPKGAYRELMYESFAQVYTYINLASGVALVVCFIIILLSMYTMVLERTREIGILRALGAGRAYMVGLSVVEALIVCVTGTGLGIALAFTAKFAIEGFRPLLTVSIAPTMILLALAIGIVGGAISALYPGYRAARLDPVAALAHE
jgi:putative ABC transport system permease protein